MSEPTLKEDKSVETLAAEYVKTFLATGVAYEFTAESIAHRSFVDGYTAGSCEVGQLKAALALGQENCDAEYDELRDERDEARAQLEVAQGRVELLEAELASAKAKHEELRISYKRSLDLRTSDAFRREDMVAENTALRAEPASAKAELAELRVSYEQNAHQCVELHRELARVKAERDEAKAELFSDQATIAETVSKYEAELAALRRDKERLDWLENREPDAAPWDYVADAINIRAAIDAAIDAAMKEVRRG